jgi:hypothetical protein
MERRDLEILNKRYPNSNARAAADLAVDDLDENTTTLAKACEVWNDIYASIANPNWNRK